MTIKKNKRIISMVCVLLLLISHLSPLLSVGYAVEESKSIFTSFNEVFADKSSLEWAVEDIGMPGERSVKLLINAEKAREEENRITYYTTDSLSIETKQKSNTELVLRTMPDPENPGATRNESVMIIDTSKWELSAGIESINYN